MQWMLCFLTNAAHSSISFAVPFGMPRIEKRCLMSDTGRTKDSARMPHSKELELTWRDADMAVVNGEEQQRAIDGKAGDEFGHEFGCARGAHDHFRSPEFAEFLCLVHPQAIQVYLHAQLACKRFLLGAGRQGDGAEAHLAGKLQDEVTEAAVGAI